MCGILGITGNRKEAVERAAQAIRYRGPDMHGTVANDDVTLGFNRLAILDLDERANQPMWNHDRSIGIVYNGEIYNYQDLKKSLPDYQFRTTSDTEVVLALYETHGLSFLKKLHGMYACAVYDATKKKVVLARDHAGIKPLYYSLQNGTLAFASEIKAVASLVRASDGLLPLSHESLRLYWAFGYIPTPHTAYETIRSLEPSSYLEFDLTTRETRLERFEPEAESVTNENDLFALIEKSVMDHLIADVPVGLFFSGGTDSSVIASVLKRHNHPLESFSIKVAGRTGDEGYFRAISDKLGLNTHVFDFGPHEFAGVYEEVMGKLDTPLADNSLLPTYFVAKKAREKVTVVLSGEGGDELFFGYPRQVMLREMYGNLDAEITFADRLALALPNVRGHHALARRITAGQPISYYLREMSPARDFLTPQFVRPAKAFAAHATDSALHLDRDLYLENDLLRKTDLATMYTSLEGRVPLLDPSIIVSARNFETAFTGETLKPVLKKMLTRDLPDDLVYRGKSGFGLNLSHFLSHTPAFKRDLDLALEYFASHDIPTPQLPDAATLLRDYGNTAFQCVALYRALINTAH